MQCIWLGLVAFGMALFLPGLASAQSIRLQTQASEIYVGMPFQLSLVLTDFDETPQPVIEPFEIDHATVELLGVSPQVSSMTTIINGRRTSRREVTFIYTYRVVVQKEGSFAIPPVRATQGAKEAVTAQRVTFTASDVRTTPDMRLELSLPERPLWVGESFDVTLDWFLRREVSGQVFSLPILEMEEYFEIEEPRTSGRERTIAFTAGSRSLNYPYTRDTVLRNGIEYTRFRVRLGMNAIRSGAIVLPPARVLAELESGRQRDGFGFERASYQLYKAEDVVRTLQVRDLPQAQRPGSFSNALGADFQIRVSVDRTIVKVGDPIVLTIDISSPRSLDGLILPSLFASGLSDQLFTVSGESPIGESIQGAGGRQIKRFQVPVRIKSERVQEIPPIAFSYFDPQREQYATVRSEPVALSVAHVEKIGAHDVVGVAPAPAPAASVQAEADFVLGHLDLGLATRPESFRGSVSARALNGLILGCYLVPGVAWILLAGLRRRRLRVLRDKPQREVVLALRAAMEAAATQDARQASAGISNAMGRFLAETQTSREPFHEILEAVDAQGYRPEVQGKPLPADLLEQLREAVRRHVNPRFARLVSTIFLLLLCFWPLPEALAQSRPAPESETMARWQQAQSAYHEAMQTEDRKSRLARFGYAASLYRELSAQYPDRVELHLDWGNAALNAADMGSASLAYRRALWLSPNQPQARQNLAHIDAILGVEHAGERSTMSAFFFLNDQLTPSTRSGLAALAFLVAGLLLVPWSVRLKRLLRTVAILPCVLWLWFLGSVLAEPSRAGEAVVLQEIWLKTADNTGASNVMSSPLAPGMPVYVLESRDSWVMVRGSNRIQGWVPKSSIEYVAQP